MTQQQATRSGSAIDIPKTIAGVLAAVSAAVVGSYLGVAGTLIGAAVASVVGSVGTELYHRWINKGSARLRSTFVTAPAAVGTPQVAAATEETPSQPEPVTRARMRWGRVAVVAAGVFVLAIGTLTAFEVITGKSAADAVGHRSSSTTTVCSVFCGTDRRTPAPTTSPSPSPSASTTAPAGPEPSASTTVPEVATSPAPLATTNGPVTQAPTGDAPTPGAPQNHIAPPSPAMPQNQVVPHGTE